MFVEHLCYSATVEVELERYSRLNSIIAGIDKCKQNHNRGFHDDCLSAMSLHPLEIQLIWQSHLHMNYELKTPYLLHCNCLWGFGATFQAFCRHSTFGQNDAELKISLLFIVHYYRICDNRFRE